MTLLFFLFDQVTGMATSYWLGHWSEDRLGWSQYEYVAGYSLIALGSIASIMFRNVFRTMLAARTMHSDLLVSVARC